MENDFNVYELLFQGDESVLVLDSGDACTTQEYTKNFLITHLNGWIVWYVNYIILKENLYRYIGLVFPQAGVGIELSANG